MLKFAKNRVFTSALYGISSKWLVNLLLYLLGMSGVTGAALRESSEINKRYKHYGNNS